MKRNGLSLGLAALSVFSCSSSFATPSQIVYGLERASHFNAQKERNLYIQVGNFKEKEKAYQQQRMLKSKTRYAVNVARKGRLYAVLIGPLHSSSEVRQAATRLVTPLKSPIRRAPIKPVHAYKPARVMFTPYHPDVRKVSKPPVIAPRSIVPPVVKSSAQWFVGAGAGAQFPVSFSDMAVNNGSDLASPYNQDLYAINTDSGGVIALSAGRRWQQDSLWMPVYSVGVSWQYYFNTQVGSTIMQYSDPTFVNYNYHWNVKSNLLLATGKLNLIQYGKCSPYINGGIGGAFNSASGYSETALADVTPRISPAFANNSTTQFAYQVGIGVDVQLTPQVIFSLGYNYQNLGAIASGAGTGTWANQTLGSGSYGSNEVLISVNYLFGY